MEYMLFYIKKWNDNYGEEVTKMLLFSSGIYVTVV